MIETLVPISALNHFAFCNRRCALIHVEGVFESNASTTDGDLAHRRVDQFADRTVRKVRRVTRLPLFHDGLGIHGFADIVEFHDGMPFPVDLKMGRKHQWDNDDIQLCAQALCLEVMTEQPVPAGAIYHVSSKRRRDVQFDDELKFMTIETIHEVRKQIERREVPPAVEKPRCRGCSLRSLCLPKAPGRIQAALDHLWETGS